MGKRSRKRSGDRLAPPSPAAAPPVAPRPAPRAVTWKADPADAPKPLWHPLPLNELLILASIILLVYGIGFASGDRRVAAVLGGIALITIGAGELALREHFAGFRSHTSLLAGIAAVVVAAVLDLATGVPQQAIIVIALAIFGVAFWRLRRLFTARSGGVGFRA
jgi:hypothetical protein